jgi:hypothetical protein
LVAGLTPFAWAATADPLRTSRDDMWQALLVGVILTGIGIAISVPLLTSWLATAMTRSRRLGPLLAGRAILNDPASAGRVVGVLGVAVLVVVGAVTYLFIWERTVQYRAAIRAYETTEGPQEIQVMPASADARDLGQAELAELRQIPGVLGLMPETAAVDCADIDGEWCSFSAVVGTCDQLALVLEFDGVCDDSRASLIVRGFESLAEAQGNLAAAVPSAPDGTLLVGIVGYDKQGDALPTQTVALDGEPLFEDLARQEERWSWGVQAALFVPEALVPDVPRPELGPNVAALGGTAVQERLADWAAERGYDAWPQSTDEYTYIQGVRLIAWALVATVLGVALLVLALGGIDRARERRRQVARQVMVGVPARLLRRTQLAQVLVPAALACALGLGAGLLGNRALANLSSGDAALPWEAWVGIVGLVAAGCLAAAVVTLPLVRSKIPPEALRRE